MTDWTGYLDGFHREHTGATERLLSRSVDPDGLDPYDWLAAAVPPGASVVDVACGSAPTAQRIHARRYLGVDRSEAELALARRRHPHADFCVADAVDLPKVAADVDAVVCSLGLQVLQPLVPTVRAFGSILRSDGRLVVTLPSSGPRTVADVARWAVVLAALRQRLHYPNEPGDWREVLASGGFRVTGDDPRRFRFTVDGEDSAAVVIEALYLPGVAPARRKAAVTWLTRTAFSRPFTLGIPLRRIVAVAARADARPGVAGPTGRDPTAP